MHKVTTINLNGRAYQIEEAGYDDLRAYLNRSESRLAENPDKTEVMADLEQAIADKFDKLLTDHKNVVTDAEVKVALEQMGEVEDDTETAKNEPDGDDGNAESDSPKGRGKRLYIIREGSVLAGVCQGMAAYFGIDVVWMRLIFVALFFITSGFWILVYIILALLMPVARTKTELAEAYGKPVTAQEIVDQFKERAPGPEQRRRLTSIAGEVLRISIKVIGIISAIIVGVASVAWAGALWLLAFGHIVFYDQLAYINGWRSWLLITAAYVVVAAVAFGTYRACMRYSDKRSPTRAQAFADGFIWVLWSIAITALLVFAVSDGHNFVEYTKQHDGYIHVGQSTICVDEALCSDPPVIR